MTRIPPCCAFLWIILFAACARAGDWPQWRGPDRDGHIPAGIAIPKQLPPEIKVLWHIPLHLGVSSPIVSGDKVIYEDAGEKKEILHVADASTGAEIWQAEIDDLHKDSQTKPGPRCTPLTDGKLLYAQSSRGQLRCFNLAGASRHGYNSPPILDGDHLIAEAGGKDAAVVCFDKRTGSILWKSQDETPAYAASMIATVAGVRQQICFMANDVMALDPRDGKFLWRVNIKTDYGRHVATPVVVGDMVVVSSFQAGLIGIKVSRDGDQLKAQRVWTSKESATNFSCPVAEGQFLYALGPAKDVVCVDVETGKQAWAKEGFFNTGAALSSHAGMLVMGKNVLMLTDGGELILFPADEAGFKEISRAPVCGKNWCNPAYANGKLYLRDEHELICLQLMPQ
jgi:outer membrane protein assembly factor BamB